MFLFVLSLIGSSIASEEMEKGDVLKEKSLVFTIEEAEDLRKRMLELEEKERRLKIYEELYSIEKSKFSSCSDSVNLYLAREKNYSEMLSEYNVIINEKNKQIGIKRYENAGYFVLGASFVIGSFYMTKAIISE